MVANKTEIRIISPNVQGLNGYKKEKRCFQYYRQQCNILCVVDTYCLVFTGEIGNEIRNEWGFYAYFSSCSSKSRDAILINNNFDIRVHEKIPDQNVIFFYNRCKYREQQNNSGLYIWTKC